MWSCAAGLPLWDTVPVLWGEENALFVTGCKKNVTGEKKKPPFDWQEVSRESREQHELQRGTHLANNCSPNGAPFVGTSPFATAFFLFCNRNATHIFSRFIQTDNRFLLFFPNQKRGGKNNFNCKCTMRFLRCERRKSENGKKNETLNSEKKKKRGKIA